MTHICIDETLISCRNRCHLIIYEPNKPHKYGFLFRIMCDCYTGIILNFFLCDVGINGAETVTMVNACAKLMEWSFHNDIRTTFYTDRGYTSIALLQLALKNKCNFIGTAQANRFQENTLKWEQVDRGKD